MKPIVYVSWILAALAVAAVALAVYAGEAIVNEAAVRAADASTVEQQTDRLAYAEHLRSLLADTADERALLDSFVGADIVNIVDTLERTAKTAGVTATVSDALPENKTVQLPGGQDLQAIAFVIQGSGTFSNLMRAVQLYEHLPLPSSIEELSLERTPANDGKSPPWRLSARIRVLTTAGTSI